MHKKYPSLINLCISYFRYKKFPPRFQVEYKKFKTLYCKRKKKYRSNKNDEQFCNVFQARISGKKMFYFQLIIFIGVKHSMFLFSNLNDQIHFKQVIYREKI